MTYVIHVIDSSGFTFMYQTTKSKSELDRLVKLYTGKKGVTVEVKRRLEHEP